MIAEKCIPIFIQAINDYHVKDDINSTLIIPSELSEKTLALSAALKIIDEKKKTKPKKKN